MKKTEPVKRNRRDGAVLLNNYFYFDIIVFSHLKWKSVYPKSKDLIRQISMSYKVLFIEKPVPFEQQGKHGFRTEIVTPRLSILKPRVHTITEISGILKRLNITEVKLAWFYSPAFIGLLSGLSAQKIIYDPVDEKAVFKKRAHGELKGQEKKLVQLSDLILTRKGWTGQEQPEYTAGKNAVPPAMDYKHFTTSEIDGLFPGFN